MPKRSMRRVVTLVPVGGACTGHFAVVLGLGLVFCVLLYDFNGQLGRGRDGKRRRRFHLKPVLRRSRVPSYPVYLFRCYGANCARPPGGLWWGTVLVLFSFSYSFFRHGDGLPVWSYRLGIRALYYFQ